MPGFEQAEENTTGVGLVSLVRHLALPHRRVVIVGAGLIGTETAATLAAAHDVTLVDMLDRPLARFLPHVSDAALAALDGLGVHFLGLCKIDSASFGPKAAVVHTSTHGDLRCDVVVSAAGFRSSLPPEFAGPDARALTLPADERLRVIGRERVWACGDCVSFPHPRWGRIGIPHWDHALWSGRHAAESILGSTAPYAREPYFFSDIGRLRIQQVGVERRGRRLAGRRRARRWSRPGRRACMRAPTQRAGAPARGSRARRLHRPPITSHHPRLRRTP